MAKANLAWVAWRQENYAEAEKIATKALDLWHGMDDPYGFDWMALLPLMATTLARKQIENAIKHAQGLFPSNQHPINDEVLSATKHAIESWNNDQIDLAASQLQSALAVAKRHHYI